MSHTEICLDLSVPLHIRLEHLKHLDTHEVDNLLECLCSMYNIHPTYLALQYLQALILDDHACLKRRIRIAEACDLGRTVLYLLTRIRDAQERIMCIEMFSNPFLKIHAYAVLFTRAPLELAMQIMKNMYRIASYPIPYLLWFEKQLRNAEILYKYRANCADFILRTGLAPKAMEDEARKFLRLMDRDDAVYTHRENVHLFVPRMQTLDRIFERAQDEKCDSQEILSFAIENRYSTKLLRQRILNDKTTLGSFRRHFTLEELLCAVWPLLTEDLRHVLLQDMESSDTTEEQGWMCTTGYYNRILNVYQCMSGENTFDLLYEIEDFQTRFFEKLNRELQSHDVESELATELTESSEEHRIRYLTFRIHSLPKVLDEMRQEYDSLSSDQFDEWVSQALRKYEM